MELETDPARRGSVEESAPNEMNIALAAKNVEIDVESIRLDVGRQAGDLRRDRAPIVIADGGVDAPNDLAGVVANSPHLRGIGLEKHRERAGTKPPGNRPRRFAVNEQRGGHAGSSIRILRRVNRASRASRRLSVSTATKMMALVIKG